MKSLLIAIAFMTVATFSYAQERGDLKGPAAKNYKPWMKKSDAEVKKVYTLKTPSQVKGPAAKNRRIFDRSDKSYQEVNFVSNRPKVTGPKAKNAKPWRN